MDKMHSRTFNEILLKWRWFWWSWNQAYRDFWHENEAPRLFFYVAFLSIQLYLWVCIILILFYKHSGEENKKNICGSLMTPFTTRTSSFMRRSNFAAGFVVASVVVVVVLGKNVFKVLHWPLSIEEMNHSFGKCLIRCKFLCLFLLQFVAFCVILCYLCSMPFLSIFLPFHCFNLNSIFSNKHKREREWFYVYINK